MTSYLCNNSPLTNALTLNLTSYELMLIDLKIKFHINTISFQYFLQFHKIEHILLFHHYKNQFEFFDLIHFPPHCFHYLDD